MLLRFRNILLLIMSLVRFFVFGRAAKEVGKPRRAVVVQLAKMGDMVCTTPVFRAIKAAYPGCEVYVVGDRVNKDLLVGSPDVDGYLVYRKNVFETMKELREKKFDFACLVGPSPEILAMLYLAGIPRIAAPIIEGGFSPQETRVYKILRKFVIPVPHRMRHYAAREYLRLLEPLGIHADDTKKHLAFSKEAEEHIARFFYENGIQPGRDFIVGISPSTGYAIKQWPAERFAKVADYLYEKYGAKIIIPGSGQDKEQINKMLSHLLPGTKVINVCGKFSIDELKALISRMSLFVSVDTGPIYIAEAFGVPTIDIVGPMDEREQPPAGDIHKIVKVERKEPQLHVMNTGVFDEREARRQAEEISVEMVKTALDELYGGSTPIIQRLNRALAR